MPTLFNTVPYDTTDVTAAITGLAFREDGAWLEASNGTAMVFFQRDGANDNFPTSRKDTGLGNGNYVTPVFRTGYSTRPDVIFYALSTVEYYLHFDGTKYVYTSPNTIYTINAAANDAAVYEDHLAVAVNGNIYVFNLEGGTHGGPGEINNAPLFWHFGSGTWLGCRFSPDGQYLAAAQSGVGLRVFKRGASAYTEITVNSRSANFVGSVDWSPEGDQIIVGTAGTFGFTVYNLTATDTFTRDTASYGPTGAACVARYVGADRSKILAVINSTAGAKVYDRAGTVLTEEVGAAPSVNNATRIAVCESDPGLIAVGRTVAPYLSVFRVEEFNSYSVEGEMSAPKATMVGAAHSSEITEDPIEYPVSMRPGVVALEALGGSLVQETPAYIAAISTLTAKPARVLDAIGFQGFGVLPSTLTAPKAQATGEIAVPFSIEATITAPAAMILSEVDVQEYTIDDVISPAPATIAAEASLRYNVEGLLSAPKATASGGAGWPQDGEGTLIVPKATADGLAVLPSDFDGLLIAPKAVATASVLVDVRSFYGIGRAPKSIVLAEAEVPFAAQGMLVAPKATVSGEYTHNVKITAELIAPKARAIGSADQPVVSGLLIAPKSVIVSGEIRRTINVDSIMRAPKARVIATSKSIVYVESGIGSAPKARFIGTMNAYYEVSGLLIAPKSRMISQGGSMDKATNAPSFQFGEEPFELGGGANFIFNNFQIG